MADVSKHNTIFARTSDLLRRLINRLLQVHSEDIVRRILNRAFIVVLLGSILIALVALPVVILLQLGTQVAVTIFGTLIAFVPLILLARRDSSVAALLAAAIVTFTNALIYTPASYIDPAVIHVGFLLPVLISSLFVRPSSGLLFVALQSVTLVVAAWLAGTDNTLIWRFFLFCIIDLLALGLPIALAAHLLRRTLAEQHAQAVQLDRLVLERTDELQRIIRIREKDTTAAVHDINNRLLVVQAEVDLLIADGRDAGIDPDVLSEAETRLERAIRAVRNLVDDLRTAALLDHDALYIDPRPLHMPDIVEQIVSQYRADARRSDCRLEIEILAAPPLIRGDARRIDRVLANLVGNAIKYSRLVPVERRLIHIQIDTADNGVLVVVIDQGPGLDQASLARLGEPFVRLGGSRSTDGMGLGIYISHGIVELHGGRLTYHSNGLDHGTRAELWLPGDGSLRSPAGEE